jgi:hypothetical protein
VSRHAYPGSALTGDYMRAAAGLVPSAAILCAAPVGPVAGGIFAALATLFAVYGVRTALQQATRIEVNETGLVAAGPLAATISWAELDRFTLAYYSTRRDRRDGWMQLKLRAGGTTIRLDSRVEGFEVLVERAARAAAARGIEISAATAANLEALGIANPGLRGALPQTRNPARR